MKLCYTFLPWALKEMDFLLAIAFCHAQVTVSILRRFEFYPLRRRKGSNRSLTQWPLRYISTPLSHRIKIINQFSIFDYLRPSDY